MLPILVAARLLKPLGNPPPHSVRFFAGSELLDAEAASAGLYLRGPLRRQNSIHRSAPGRCRRQVIGDHTVLFFSEEHSATRRVASGCFRATLRVLIHEAELLEANRIERHGGKLALIKEVVFIGRTEFSDFPGLFGSDPSHRAIQQAFVGTVGV